MLAPARQPGAREGQGEALWLKERCAARHSGCRRQRERPQTPALYQLSGGVGTAGL